MEELDPRKHDVRDVDWERLWMMVLPYIAKDLGTDDRLDNLDPYLIEAVEKDQNREAMQYLLFFAIHTFCQNLSESGWSDDGATKYVIELLYKIYCGEEPNKVFKWVKPARGPRKLPKHEQLLAIAVPELVRKDRKEEIEKKLDEPDLSRRERASLEKEYVEVKSPLHIKCLPINENDDPQYYSDEGLREIMKKHEIEARTLIDVQPKLHERFLKAAEAFDALRKLINK